VMHVSQARLTNVMVALELGLHKPLRD